MNNEDLIQVAIVDDHTLFREGIARLLLEFDEIRIAFEASNGTEMKKKLAGAVYPHVILMDVAMPQMDGFASTKWLREHHPAIRVLALSMFEEDSSIIEMLKTGAGGYILKESKPRDLVTAIKAIYQQGYFINEQVSGKLLRSLQGAQPTGKLLKEELSENELKFLEWCCSELTYKEIADKMHLSHHTIDNYRESLFQKFGLKTRTGLVIFGIKNNLIKV